MFLVRGNIQKHQGMSDYLKKFNRPSSPKGKKIKPLCSWYEWPPGGQTVDC